MKRIIVILFVTIFQTRGNEVDLFSSTSDMERLYEREKEFTQKIEEHLSDIDSQLKSLDWFLDTYYKNYNYTEDDAAEYVSNPINTYVMLKRTALQWPQVKQKVFNVKAQERLEELIALLETFPKEADMDGAFSGLLLLHETYNFNLTEVAAGKIRIPGTEEYIETDYKLFPYDLVVLGKLAFNRGFYDRSYEFLVAAKELMTSEHADLMVEADHILKVTMQKHDEVLLKKGPRGESWKTYQVPFDPKTGRSEEIQEP